MHLFRLYVAILFITIVTYTVIVFANHGAAFVPEFIAGVTSMTWTGQFNVDFMMYLGISAIWIVWRHRFTPAGFILGFVALTAGALFLMPYLFVVAGRAQGDPAVLLLGKDRADARVTPSP